MTNGPLVYPNVPKFLVSYLKEVLPSDWVVSTVVPKIRTPKMVIIRLVTGREIADIRSVMNVNLMTWGTTWEESLDSALMVDSKMRGLNNYPSGPVLNVSTTVMPFPSGDGTDVETPVSSASYALIVLSENS
jgi:hypothetical protein